MQNISDWNVCESLSLKPHSFEGKYFSKYYKLSTAAVLLLISHYFLGGYQVLVPLQMFPETLRFSNESTLCKMKTSLPLQEPVSIANRNHMTTIETGLFFRFRPKVIWDLHNSVRPSCRPFHICVSSLSCKYQTLNVTRGLCEWTELWNELWNTSHTKNTGQRDMYRSLLL